MVQQYSKSKLQSLKKEQLQVLAGKTAKIKMLKKDDLIDYILENVSLNDPKVDLSDFAVSKSLKMWSSKPVILRNKATDTKLTVNITTKGFIKISSEKEDSLVNSQMTVSQFNVLRKQGLPIGLRKLFKDQF